MNLANKTILLTGATGGIGSLLTSKLTAAKANLITLGRDPNKPASYHTDLANPTSRQELIKQILSDYPSLDIIIHAAGIGIYKSLVDLTSEDWYQSYELNVFAPLFLAQQLHPQLNLVLGSCSAFQHTPERSLYNSTKAALRALTLCLAQEQPGHFVHLALDSTLTAFGPLTLAQKQAKQKDGKIYLDPSWVSDQIISILQNDSRDTEYVLSPDCYPECGTWHKP
ncbi:MAG: short-chain dehydrogenase/reductase SDR [Microgenomates group bacterium GW2011_GWC1_46_16]|uniref:Short-chain dehydrogenase n=2 Tax=Candidatus Collieribacteriota TaxID=1752725 RepID=A0A1F5FZK5_9BACT|nr:MAG: Short chain dehydrogenase [Microgenomates group bacterium GW2011_GWF1_46_12]KKU26649.1 MAG: short-chain dehydrogenase/reductase SDR [Microgenomates group bacterium GW2011_GWC1_46_16]KKU28095.1 MAG: Short chain dehydrogenase [Microgenomates group bacterium GW2011_GWF2_46_18]KKU43956.1 MAG: Short chain dehydrogenase [Microgenomates group bacterium GW2011_GWA1_46_7]KKU45760.1 MAG: Short chain dehydrogenase [Microgenomates group bacterium GW2011_GWB1_46_7]KKU60513.1 MAG: Short chain dehydr